MEHVRRAVGRRDRGDVAGGVVGEEDVSAIREGLGGDPAREVVADPITPSPFVHPVKNVPYSVL